MSDFTQSLIDIRKDFERKRSEFSDSWISTRRLIYQAFAEASQALDNPKIEHDNGASSTLRWRGGSISFKADDRRLKIVRERQGEPEEAYDPSALTQEKIESEVRSFVIAVLGG